MKTVIGLFDTSSEAFAAQNELLAAGLNLAGIAAVLELEAANDRLRVQLDNQTSGKRPRRT